MCFRPVQRAHHLGRHLAVVVEHEVVAGEQPGQRVGRHFELLVHRHRRIVGTHHATEHVRQIVHRIEKQPLHRIPRRLRAQSAQAGVTRQWRGILLASALPAACDQAIAATTCPRASRGTAARAASPRDRPAVERRRAAACSAGCRRDIGRVPASALRAGSRCARSSPRSGARWALARACCCGSRATCRGPRRRWMRRGGRA